MKNLKLLFLTLLSVLSFNLFSQTQVYTSSTSGPNICDGTAVLDTTNLTMTSIVWQGMGMIINQGSYMVTNLCPGTYGVSFISNNTPITLTFTITAGSFNPCLNFSGLVMTANSLDSVSCDGVMGITLTNGTAPYTYQWSNGQTTQTMNSLCPGGYCCYVTDVNGCTLTLCDTVGVQSPNYGDTLYLTTAGSCTNPMGTFTNTIEDCSIDYNSIDSAYVSNIILPQNPLDSVAVVWTLVDTSGSIQGYTTLYTGAMSTGCYNFQLILYCLQKSMDYKTIVINHTDYLEFVGIEELFGNNKQLVSVTDLLGRETNIQTNKMLVYTYSDGSREIKYINE
jgi:hypothetical protein